MFISQDVLVFMGNIGMSLWGATIRYLLVRLRTEYDARRKILGLMSAIFLAVVVYLSYSYLNIPVKLSFVASGFLGYTGVDSIDMLRRAVMYKKFGLKAEDYETQETKEEVKARG